MEPTPRIEIHFGALSPSFADQIRAHGWEFPDIKRLDTLQRAADNLTFMKIHGFITDTEARKVRERIGKAVVKGARRALLPPAAEVEA